MATILITGAGGMLGSTLLPILQQKGHKVKTLSTKKTRNPDNYFWNVENRFIEDNALDGVDVIIHLAGANIGNHRWSKRYRQEIVDSRVASAELLLDTLKLRKQTLHQFILVSAIGYYPDPSSDLLSENSKAGKGFLAKLCNKWEEVAHRFHEIHARVCILRTGPVLSLTGGLLPVVKQSLPFRILPVFGSYKNMLSWIHIQDACGILNFVHEKSIEGTYNAVAPQPCAQIDFLMAIAGNKFCFYPPLPAFALKLFLGERAMLPLSNQNVSSLRLQELGYHFKYHDVRSAVQNLTQQH